jgi:hypothetical protein
LHDWVSRGGALFVCGTPNAPAEFGPAGFGQVTAIADPRIQVSSTALLIHSLRGTIESKLANDYSGQWGARKELGEIKANVPLLMVFLMIFGALAGPINLFVFAGHGARHRLFWTTPVISLAASALLFVLIVLKDGFGGSGVRFALVQIMPAAKKSVALQEQISRTGVLRSASFITHDPTLIAPITLDSRTNAPKRKYENVDTKFGGEWFTSRSIQAHWLETIAPTRAEISLLNAAEVRGAGAAPVLVSSMAMPLDQVYFRDDRGGAWQVRNMHTGEKMTLQRIASIPNLLPIESGQRLRDMWDQVKDQTGTFYAVTSDPRALVETLPSIRWKDQRAIYLGPVARASP